MSKIPVVYVAHPLGAGPDRESNRKKASVWAAWIAKTFRVAVVADWIILSGEWDESPENRDLGPKLDFALVELCHVVVMVGPRVSLGMQLEAGQARAVVDWTGTDSPARFTASAIENMRSQLKAAIWDGRPT